MIPSELTHREELESAAIDVGVFFEKACTLVSDKFSAIDERVGAVLVAGLTQSMAYQFRTFILNDSLTAVDSSLSEISLVIDNLEAQP